MGVRDLGIGESWGLAATSQIWPEGFTRLGSRV